MNSLNPAVSYSQFVSIAAQDGIIFLGVIQAAKRIANWWLATFIMVCFFVPMLILAQFVPFYFRKHLSIIFPALPYIKERDSLIWLRDAFLLYFYALKGYRPFCLFRRELDALIEELDEHVDSIAFVLENPNLISNALANISAPTHSPSTPPRI